MITSAIYTYFLIKTAAIVLFSGLPHQWNPEEEPTIDDDLLQELHSRYEAAERIPAELQYRILRNWRGEGMILIGRIVRPIPDTDIARRATIYQDESFATAIYPGRTLEFYAHGFDPLVVKPKYHIWGPLFDAGDIAFEKSPMEDLRTLSGSVRLEDANADGPEIELELRIPNNNPLSRDHGHWQHRTVAVAERQSLQSSSEFHIEGLSPLYYELKLSAPGYIQHVSKIKSDETGTVDLGAITLHKAKTLRFDYLSRIDLDAEPKTWPDPQSQEILCDDTTFFLFTDYRDELRNRMRLRLPVTDGVIEATFPWVPSEYYDLGPGQLEDFTQTNEWVEQLSNPVSTRRLQLQSGHVYFFRNTYKEVNCLFQVTEF